MNMDFTENFFAINLLMVFGATLAANLIGALWYSPLLFGNSWRAALGKGPATGEMANSTGVFIASFILHMISASLLSAMLGSGAGGETGVRFGALIGIAFVATAMGATNLFEQRPLKLLAINSGYHIVSLCTMGFILGMWS